MALALLVDDDQQLLASVAASARTSGLDLMTAGSWDEGLALFHVLSPELVIADYNMPGSRMGLQLLVEIRRLRPSVRLVLVSGYLDAQAMAKVEALDFVDATLTKGSAVETAQAILGEIRTASERAPGPTDWRAFARAYVDAARVSDEDIDQLDKSFGGKLDSDGDVSSAAPATGLVEQASRGYFDTSALMRWVERDVQAPEERNVRVGTAVAKLLEGKTPLAVSGLTLVEFRAAVAADWRSSEPDKAECDAEWAERAKVAAMKLLADGRVDIVPVPPHAAEHAMTLVDMAARDHGLKLGTWDAIHLITACAWAHSESARVRLYTTNGHFEDFTGAYPHFERFAEIVHLDRLARA
jgi:ActR/RegA family two-component response regulator